MAQPGDLIDLADALAWLGQTADADGSIANLISAVSKSIEGWIGYPVLTATYSSAFNGDNNRALALPNRPITAVASVSIDGRTQVPAQNLPNTHGFSFNESTVFLSGAYVFCRGFQNVAITYTAGYAEVPADLQQACRDWISAEYGPKSQGLDAGIIEAKAGGSSWKRGVTKTGMPMNVANVLSPYKRVF